MASNSFNGLDAKSTMYDSHGPSKLVAKSSRVSSSNGTKRASWMTAIGSA